MKKPAIILIALAFIVLGVVLGFLLWPKQLVNNGQPMTNQPAINQPITNNPEPTATTTEPETITSDIDTSDWQTYRNEEYGVEVKYPAILNALEVPYPGKDSDFKETIYFDLFKDHIDSPNISITVKDTKGKVVNYEKLAESYDTFNNENYKIQKATIGGKTVTQIKFEYRDIVTFFEKGNLLYSVYFLPAGDIDRMIYDSFLLSFHFTNK